ncbi:alpha/beta hydrolase [Lacticaseibacillus hegangensis]|nr:alpha/beta fold hydrolase [Lacticaseibacillus hegangensis]
MMNQTMVKIAMPDAITAEEKLPTVWLLHGLGDDGSVWQRKVPVEQYAIDHHWAIVMPGFNRSSYMNMAYGSRYGDYLEQELIPTMRSMLPLSVLSEQNWVVGNSMGGYGAMRLAFRHPNWFSAVATMSAVADLNSIKAIMPDYQAVFGPDDCGIEAAQLTSVLSQADVLAVQKLRFYQSVGQDDPFKKDNDTLVHQLTTEYGLSIAYHVEPGNHSWQFWRDQLPVVLDWLAQIQKKN